MLGLATQMVRVVVAMYVPLQICVVVSCSSPTLSDETFMFAYHVLPNFICCSLILKKTKCRTTRR
jgi:hypothetical protein